MGRLAALRQHARAADAACAPGVDGKLRIGDDGLLPTPPDPAHDPAQVPGFWLGIGLMQTSSSASTTRSATGCAAEYPSWTDDELFERARLINAALIAKIHTVEWTPAVISHPTTEIGDARQLVGPRRREAAQACSAASRRAR